jgi:NAD kinase
MLGVKMGRLGFLAEVQPADWQTPLEALMAGRYWVEERLMVRMHVERFDPFLVPSPPSVRTTRSTMWCSAAATLPAWCASAPNWMRGI